MAKFVLWHSTSDRKWYWHLKANNGQIICWAEGYNSKNDALYSISWLRVNAPVAILEDQS